MDITGKSGMSVPYVQRFRVRYSDLDSNGHVANTSYMRYTVDTRWGYFESKGFTPNSLMELGFGPVVLSEKITYLKELFANEEIEVHFWTVSLDEDGRRFELRLDIRRSGGEIAAHVDVLGGWMNLKSRRLEKPPAEVWDLMSALLVDEGPP